ncbi:MAG: 2'-deoxycytidine 5'-triphosphate deaminase [Candidatus Zixiibacteriota bacterium]
MSKEDYKEFRPGVLNQEQVLNLDGAVIHNLKNEAVDLSAFDLHISQQGWEMKGSIKASQNTNIDKIIREFSEHALSNGGPWILKTGKTYIFALREYLTLPNNSKLFGQATGKSSIGRLDVLTRLMVNNCPSFDTIKDDGYKGSLYLEVTPITFPIQVQEGNALCQLRLFRGLPEWSEIKEEELQLFGPMILKEDGEPKIVDVKELTVNLMPDEKGISVFGTKEKKEIEEKNIVVDLTKGTEFHNPKEFWEDIKLKKDFTLEITPERFYILRSKERFKLPLNVAVSCQAVSETLGELRIHYAGFVHPGFGFDREKGTPIIFEVRGHNVTTFLRDGETLAHFKYYWMSERCKEQKKSGYEEQELKLSRYFKEWTK